MKAIYSKLSIIFLLMSISLSFQNCELPSISKELQELSILYRLISTDPVNTNSEEDSEESAPEEVIVPTFTISYNGNGSDGGDPPEDTTEYTNGQFITILGNTGSMTLVGNTFVGWNTETDGSGDSYVAGNTIQVDGANIQLYAQWSALPTFTVTYDGNGSLAGTPPTDGNAYLEGATVTVLGNTGALSLTGNSFTGWNTAPDGSGTDYDPTDSFAMPGANVTLYAQWTALPTFTVTYDGNGSDGGAVPVDTDNYLAGENVTVLDNTGNLTRTGFSFNRWNTSADGSGTNYDPADTFPMPAANVTLYAQWSPAFNVTYMANGGTAGTPPNDPAFYQETDTVTVLGNPNSLVKTGRAWIGWNTAADGTGTTYTEGQTFAMPASNLTLYAMYLEGIFAFAHFDTGAVDCFDATTGPSPCPIVGFPSQAPENTHALTIAKSLTDNGDETVTDNLTGLIWRKCPVGLSGNDCDVGMADTFDFADAQNSCTIYGAGWRPPTILEAATLLDNRTGSMPVIDTNFFLESGGSFHTSTTDGASFHFISFDNGTISANTFFHIERKVRCVFGENVTPPISLTDEGDGTIRDNISGLIWQKCHSGRNNDLTCSDNIAEGDTLSWQDALQYCGSLNLATHSDWRLPNRNELLSLVDFSIAGSNKFNTTLFNSPMFNSQQLWSTNPESVVAGNTRLKWLFVNSG
ncbi:MAG: InlB B-repeat-containing protein, partial [Leptospira sp.]|nr:InlB B-repeat-containing protein [Leptospira sp.]